MKQLLNFPIHIKAILLLFCIGGILMIAPGLQPFLGTVISEGQDRNKYQIVKVTLRDKSEDKKIPNVIVDIETDGPPDSIKSDSNGYFELKIPARQTATIFLNKAGYRNEKYVVNLRTNPDTTKTLYMDRVVEQDNIGEASTSLDIPKVSESASKREESAQSLKQSNSVTIPDNFQGEWIANLRIADSKSSTARNYRYRLTLSDGTIGEKVGERKALGYPPCESGLILMTAETDQIKLLDSVSSGNCISDGTIVLTTLGKDLLDYTWSHKDSENNVTGKLSRK